MRRAKMVNGKEAFILCGTALPENFPIESINDNDEVWCARLAVMDVSKYKQRDGSTGYKGSPEDFLSESPNLKGEFCEWEKKV